MRSSCSCCTRSSRRRRSRSAGSAAACVARSSSAQVARAFCFWGISTCRNCSSRSQRGRCASRRLSSSRASPILRWLSSRYVGIFSISLCTVSSNLALSSSLLKPRRQNWHVFFVSDFSRNFSYMCFALSVIATSFLMFSTSSRCAVIRAKNSACPPPPSSAARRDSSACARLSSASAAWCRAAAVLRRCSSSWQACLCFFSCSSTCCASASTLASDSAASGICPSAATSRGRASASLVPRSFSASHSCRRSASTWKWASLCASIWATSPLLRWMEYCRSCRRRPISSCRASSLRCRESLPSAPSAASFSRMHRISASRLGTASTSVFASSSRCRMMPWASPARASLQKASCFALPRTRSASDSSASAAAPRCCRSRSERCSSPWAASTRARSAATEGSPTCCSLPASSALRELISSAAARVSPISSRSLRAASTAAL
mmetsp:Transcript_71168/g.201884  ORF Transcript_71168/g.201884 Transcript_71168/m.201884 type:complete len:438 (+) Transcript_71168:389-1702(+)